MKTSHRQLTAVAVVAMLATGCSFESSSSQDATGGGASSPVDATVSVTNQEFTPATLEVEAGGAVTWEWEQGTHNVVFEDDGSDILSDGTWNRTFDEPGTHNYECTLHSGMNGTVVVR